MRFNDDDDGESVVPEIVEDEPVHRRPGVSHLAHEETMDEAMIEAVDFVTAERDNIAARESAGQPEPPSLPMRNGLNGGKLQTGCPQRKGRKDMPLKEELARQLSEGKTLQYLVRGLIIQATRGNPAALKIVFDRIDGPITPTVDPDEQGTGVKIVVYTPKKDPHGE